MSALNRVGWSMGFASILFLIAADPSSAQTSGDEPTVSVEGVVVDGDGQPVPGAVVWAVPGRMGVITFEETRADDLGAFRLGLKPGRWSVRARKDLTQGKAYDEYGRITIVEGAVPDAARIVLEPAGRLHGQILDASTSLPLPGARIWLDEGVLVTSDDEGRYVHEGLAMEDHKLYVLHPGYERKRFLIDTTFREDARLNLRVPRGGLVTGRVVDETGAGIPYAEVNNPGSGHTVALSARFVRADEHGRFVRDGLGYERTYRLNVRTPGFAENDIGNVEIHEGAEPPDVTIRLVRENAAEPADSALAAVKTVPVSGEVLSPDGQPVPGADLRWLRFRPNAGTSSAKSDSNGRFVMSDVPDTDGILMAFADGYGVKFAPVNAGETEGLQVHLNEERIAVGRVVDEDGNPFEGVTVIPQAGFAIQNMGGTKWFPSLQTKTDQAGNFRLTRLSDSGMSYDFLGRRLSGLRRQPLEFGAVGNRIVMTAMGAIRGRVVDSLGNPVDDFRILIQIPRERRGARNVGGYFAGFGGIGISFSNEDGEFIVSDLVAGNYHRVVAVSPKYGDAANDWVLADPLNRMAPAGDLVLSMGDPVKVGAHVLGLEKDRTHPVSGAVIYAIDIEPGHHFSWGRDEQSWNRVHTERTNEEGTAEFENVEFDRAQFAVRAPGFGRQLVAWRSADNELPTVILEPEAVVEGVAMDENGRPLASGHVSLSTGNATFQHSIRESDMGRFSFLELPGGRYSLNIQFNGRAVFNESFDLKPGDVRRVVSNSLEALDASRQPQVFAQLAEKLSPGDEAPTFSVPTLDAKTIELSQFRGKYVLLDFWATWCGPCIGETPHLLDTFKAHGANKNFAIISLSVDEPPDAPRGYAAENGMDWHHATLGDWSTSPIMQSYGINGIPSILLLDREGKILRTGLRGPEILAAVTRALSGQSD